MARDDKRGRQDYDALPTQLKARGRFVLCKGKVPYYATTKRMRHHSHGSDDDLSNLVGFEVANELYKSDPQWTGIGVCLIAGDGIGVLDADGEYLVSGSPDEGHVAHQFIAQAERAGCWGEISLSGRGLHMFGDCAETSRLVLPGTGGKLEYFGANQFVALTGDCWSQGWGDLNATVQALKEAVGARTKPIDERDDDDGPIITRQTLADLRDALSAIDADNYELWVRIGHNLKSLPGRFEDEGKALWLEWSAKSDRFNEADALAKWDTFNPHKPSWRAVFTEASDNWRWANPRKGKALKDEPAKPLGSRKRIDLGAKELHPTEFVLDGFMEVGTVAIAGAWGAGKSTNLIPLFASVAHLAPEEWGFWPALRRKIVWVTEAPEQARDTLYSLAESKAGSAEWSEFHEWFHLYPSRREPAKVLAQEAKAWVEAATWKNESGFTVKPVVVIDTTSANIELDNENDNSQVSTAVHSLREALPDHPIVLIGHTPKAMRNRTDLADVSFRGGGAWEGDVVGTYYLVHDQDTDMRFLASCKRRFTASYTEILFGHEDGSTTVDTPWGGKQHKTYLHGVPSKSDGSARKAARAEVVAAKKEERRERGRTERQEQFLAFIRECAAEGRLATKKAIKEALGGNNEMRGEVVKRLLEAELIQEHTITKEQADAHGLTFKGQKPDILLPTEVDLELFLGRLEKGDE